MPSPPQDKRWRGRLALLFLGLLLGSSLGEITLRIVGYEGDFGRQQTVLGTPYGRIPPDKWIFHVQIDPQTQETVNIRGQSIPIEKPPGETRMLFIGDSGTAGLYLDIQHSFPMQFKQRLDQENPDNRIGVINGGAVGMTNVGEYYLLRDKLIHLQPDVVVLGLFLANDINFNLGHQERLDARGSGWLDRLQASSALVHFLRLRYLDSRSHQGLWQDSPDVALPLIDRDGIHMLNDSAGEIATYMREPSELTERAFRLLHAVLQDFVELGAEHDFSFSVLLIPTRSTVTGSLDLPYHPDMLEDLVRHGSDIRQADLDFSLPTRRVQAICAELGILCIDPTARMQSIGEAVFLPDDEHMSIQGYGVLAQELRKNLDLLLSRDR